MNKNLILLLLTCLMLVSASTFSQIIKIDVDANPDGICEGETDTLRVLVTAGVDQPRLIRYKWTADPPTQFFPDDSYPTVRVKPSVKTTFTVTVTNVDFPANEFF
jgi:hypothetical protein